MVFVMMHDEIVVCIAAIQFSDQLMVVMIAIYW